MRSPSFKRHLITACRLIAIVGVVALSTGCSAGRRPIPAGEIPRQDTVLASDEEYGHEVLSSLVEKFPLDNDDTRINRVRDMVEKLAKAAGADQNPWQVYVLRDDSLKNAAATRGNYVFIWTGMLNTVQSDGELAAILSHEIAHVLAGHPQPTPDEEVREMVSGVAGTIAGGILSNQGAIGPLADLAEMAVGEVMKAVLVNPEQQRKELEADQIGLFILADAGYNPEEALGFWERAKSDPELSGGSLLFLSTHPSSADRLEKLKKFLPEALERYAAKNDDSRPSGRSKNPRNTNVSWRVDAASAEVLSEPSSRSDRITDLPDNTPVTVIASKRQWLQISAPVAGYIHRDDVERIVSGK